MDRVLAVKDMSNDETRVQNIFCMIYQRLTMVFQRSTMAVRCVAKYSQSSERSLSTVGTMWIMGAASFGTRALILIA